MRDNMAEGKMAATLTPSATDGVRGLEQLAQRLAQLAPVFEFAPVMAWRASRSIARDALDLRRAWNTAPGTDVDPVVLAEVVSKARKTAAVCREVVSRLSGWYQTPARRHFTFIAAELEDLAEAAELSADTAARAGLRARIGSCLADVGTGGPVTDWRKELARL